MRPVDPTVLDCEESHRRVIERLRADPTLIAVARNLLDRWIERAGGALPIHTEWQAALAMLDRDELVRFLESQTPRALRMKISSPFPAALRLMDET